MKNYLFLLVAILLSNQAYSMDPAECSELCTRFTVIHNGTAAHTPVVVAGPVEQGATTDLTAAPTSPSIYIHNYGNSEGPSRIMNHIFTYEAHTQNIVYLQERVLYIEDLRQQPIPTTEGQYVYGIENTYERALALSVGTFHLVVTQFEAEENFHQIAINWLDIIECMLRFENQHLVNNLLNHAALRINTVAMFIKQHLNTLKTLQRCDYLKYFNENNFSWDMLHLQAFLKIFMLEQIKHHEELFVHNNLQLNTECRTLLINWINNPAANTEILRNLLPQLTVWRHKGIAATIERLFHQLKSRRIFIPIVVAFGQSHFYGLRYQLQQMGFETTEFKSKEELNSILGKTQ